MRAVLALPARRGIGCAPPLDLRALRVSDHRRLDPDRERGSGFGNTGEARFDGGIGGSRGTHVVGRCALIGAQILKTRLEELAAEVMGWPAGQVHLEDDAFKVGDGSRESAPYQEVAARIAPYGWHVDVQMDGRDLPLHVARLAALPCDVVIDHVGKFMEPVAPDHPGVRALQRLLDGGHAWVKLSAPSSSTI